MSCSELFISLTCSEIMIEILRFQRVSFLPVISEPWVYSYLRFMPLVLLNFPGFSLIFDCLISFVILDFKVNKFSLKNSVVASEFT